MKNVVVLVVLLMTPSVVAATTDYDGCGYETFKTCLKKGESIMEVTSNTALDGAEDHALMIRQLARHGWRAVDSQEVTLVYEILVNFRRGRIYSSIRMGGIDGSKSRCSNEMMLYFTTDKVTGNAWKSFILYLYADYKLYRKAKAVFERHGWKEELFNEDCTGEGTDSPPEVRIEKGEVEITYNGYPTTPQAIGIKDPIAEMQKVLDNVGKKKP